MKNKFVQLIVLKDIYKEKNLKLNNHGMVIDNKFNNLTVMFFNENNIGEYIIVDVDNKDVKVLDFDIPKKFKHQIEDYLKSHSLKNREKLTDIHFNDCDWVELIIENKKYTKYNIHKGERGAITNGGLIFNNEVLVDFTGIDENGNFYGEVISVNINDLKLVEKNESDE